MRRFFFIALLMFSIMPQNAKAVESAWSSASEVQARILSGVETIGAQNEFDAALELRLSPGWHTYWRSPGEAGLAPRFNWEGSENLSEALVKYPLPSRIDEAGFVTFGYDGDIILPLKIKPEEPNKAMKINLGLDVMVCKEICIPEHLELELDIDAGQGKNSGHMAVIKRANSKVPMHMSGQGLEIGNITVTQDTIVATIESKRGFDQSEIFFEINEIALPGKVERQIDPADEKKAIYKIAIPQDVQEHQQFIGRSSLPFAGAAITITFSDGQNAVEGTLIIH